VSDPFLRYKLAAMSEPEKNRQAITLEQVRQVARLSRLALSEDELARLAPQLESILEYVAKIRLVNVSDVVPMAHALPLANVLRDDVVEPSLPLEKVLANAPETDGPFFKVPKIIGGEEDSAG
jgi:aspartyl-tRNA(Asn)/glutamyl-tRNA(Gln) amidotransferase subunit C